MIKKLAIFPILMFSGWGLYAQNDIVIESTLINNENTFYGASNSIHCAGDLNKPVDIFTGDKKVEFVAGNEIRMSSGFRSAAQNGGYFRAYIDPYFSLSNSPLPLMPNEFKIGMFGFNYINNDDFYADPSIQEPWGVAIPEGTSGSILINGVTANSSQLNVLKDDGFNIVQKYNWPESYVGDINVFKPMLDLAKNIGIQLMPNTKNYWKPNLTGFEGSIVTNGRGSLPTGTQFALTARPDYDDLLENLFTDPIYQSTIWGYQMSEEFSHAQPGNPLDTKEWCWNACDDRARQIDCPPSYVSEAIEHFRDKLDLKGNTSQKMAVMESFHYGSIRENSYYSNYADGTGWCDLCPASGTSTTYIPYGTLQGYSQAQDYINPLHMGNNMPDVFLEGSYWYNDPTPDSWADHRYLHAYNSTYLNGEPNPPSLTNQVHYLGVFKSIDYAYSNGINEVHKVINGDAAEAFHFDKSIENANALWFQSYTSIIHGAKGIWFWGLPEFGYDPSDPADQLRKETMLNSNNTNDPARFNRENFPLKYEKFVQYLSKELAYLVRKNLLSTDPKTILYSKTDGPDENCVVPPAADYIPNALKEKYGLTWQIANGGRYGQVANDGEAYGLRYTIRTNGEEVIMIISNPLGVSVKDLQLDFNTLTNPIIKSAGGVQVWWSDPHSPDLDVDDPLYRTDRSNGINLNTLTLGGSDADYYPFLPDKKLKISLGPLDVQIFKFITSPNTPLVDANNGWDQVWTNAGNNSISSWLLRTTDLIVNGDFNGDGSEELLCMQESSSYASLLDYYNNDWQTIWSNLGNNFIGPWQIRNSDIAVSGDFDGDSQDELLLAQETSNYSLVLKLSNNSWAPWSGGVIGNWQINTSDKIIAGDFDGLPDNKDEILCISSITNLAQIFSFINGSWIPVWSNFGNGMIDNWQLSSVHEYSVGDIDNDGIDEVLCYNTVSGPNIAPVQFLKFNAGNWSSSNSLLNGIPNWHTDMYTSLPGGLNMFTGNVLLGNCDYDGNEELMYISPNGNSITAEQINVNDFQINWKNDIDAPYIDNWNAGFYTSSKYLFIKANKFLPEFLLAFNGDQDVCIPFLVSMYMSLDLTNKKTAFSSDALKLDSTGGHFIDNSLFVFPNPTPGKFALVVSNYNNRERGDLGIPINYANMYHVDIYNAIGKKVYSKMDIPSNMSRLLIDLSLENPGVYIIRVIDQFGESRSTRVVIQ